MSTIKHNYLNAVETKPTTDEIGQAEIVPNLADGSLWTKDTNDTVIRVGGGDISTEQHNVLQGRTAVDSHSIGAITGLEAALATANSVSTVASSVLLNQSSLALDDFAITKNFAAVTYTGNGDTQDIVTGISSTDINYDSTRTYSNQQDNNLAFDRNSWLLMQYTNSTNGAGLGSELVVNGSGDWLGDFDVQADVDAWTAENGATLTLTAETMGISGGAADVGASINIPTEIGKIYKLSYTTTGARVAFLYINNVEQRPNTLTSSFVGSIDYIFKAELTTTKLTFSQGSSGDVDNIIVDSITTKEMTGWIEAPSDVSIPCNLTKNHIKNLESAFENVIIDGLRGKDVHLYSDTTTPELTHNYISSFNNDGFTLDTTNSRVNEDLKSHVLYQTLYTHLKYGVTNQNKNYIEAFNPVTRETMIMYEGSGNAGHEIPHGLGVELDYWDTKNLSDTSNWQTTVDLISDYSGAINNDKDFAGSLFNRHQTTTDTVISIDVVEVGNANNTDANFYILYGKSKSETWTIVNYTGTGAAGNFVECKDVNGVARKPARVIVKRVNDTGNWTVNDNGRDINDLIRLNLSDEETNFNVYPIFQSNGFLLNGDSNSYNSSGNQYIALVEFDTNSNGGDSYFNLPTDDSNLNVTDGVFTYTDGLDSNGYVSTSEQVTQSIDFSGVSDGLKWVGKKLDGSGYVFFDNKPTFNIETGSGYEDDGVTPLSTPVSFLPFKVNVQAETPMYIGKPMTNRIRRSV